LLFAEEHSAVRRDDQPRRADQVVGKNLLDEARRVGCGECRDTRRHQRDDCGAKTVDIVKKTHTLLLRERKSALSRNVDESPGETSRDAPRTGTKRPRAVWTYRKPPGVRGKGITSRMLPIPETNCTSRSKPSPKPACGALP